MSLLELYFVVIGITSLAVLTLYKYNGDLAYDRWAENQNILPKKFCLQCFATQCALMVSTIIVLSLGLPMWYIIMLTLSTAPYVILLINKI